MSLDIEKHSSLCNTYLDSMFSTKGLRMKEFSINKMFIVGDKTMENHGNRLYFQKKNKLYMIDYKCVSFLHDLQPIFIFIFIFLVTLKKN